MPGRPSVIKQTMRKWCSDSMPVSHSHKELLMTVKLLDQSASAIFNTFLVIKKFNNCSNMIFLL